MPAWAVPVISLFSPVVVILLYTFWRQSSRLEAHNAILAALSCVITTALVTNLIKLGVGRPRPDFVARCWPDGRLEFDAQSGLPACAKGGANPAEGRKSFPSGALLLLFLLHCFLVHEISAAGSHTLAPACQPLQAAKVPHACMHAG